MNSAIRKKAGMTMIELLVSMSIFITVSAVTFVLYRDARANIERSSSRITAAGAARVALERLEPVLGSAYIPPLRNVNSAFLKPNPPYPAGVSAPSGADPLLPLRGTGSDSIIFFAPADLINKASPLFAVPDSPGQQRVYAPNCGIHLYELRLDAGVYTPDPDATYQPDQAAVGNAPPLVMRSLVLRELYVPDSPSAPFDPNPANGFQYLVPGSAPDSPTGNGFSSSPAPVPPVSYPANTPTRILARNLSDVRFALPGDGLSVRVAISAQDREGTLNKAKAKTIHTTTLNSYVYYVAGH